MVRANAFLAVLMVLVLGTLAGCGSSGGGPATATGGSTRQVQGDLGPPRYAATPAAAAPASVAEPETVRAKLESAPAAEVPPEALPHEGRGPGEGGDKYALIEENEFLTAKDAPLSTFSIDVDTASYAKTRSYLLDHHRLPPPDAVRIEELVNYFDYAYAGPTDEHPFAVHVETAGCPWQPVHRLVRVGIQGKRLDHERPVTNLVFLIDVSGSMNEPKRLPLVQRSLAMLVRQLGENDFVSIVVYAGAAGLVLPPTSGAEQSKILAAIDNLRAGGSTNGGQGIQLAYGTAKQHFIKHGVNRVLLCTDGDFNVGVTSTGELVRLAAAEAKGGIYLSVLGYGFDNHNDELLEELSNKANGNYAFIDSDAEARKVLVAQMQGTLVTIAKDVKIQVEFNPVTVAAYRLIGYENRRLADRDFNDDSKDAGDIGAGHSVTALYELVPAGVDSPYGKPSVDPLKYQESGVGDRESGDKASGKRQPPDESRLTAAAASGELLTLKLRYQPPAGGPSTLLTFPVKDSGAQFGSASGDLQFAAAVASFGMLLRGSKFKGETTFAAVLETASAARGEDQHGLRAEFLELVKAAQQLSGPEVGGGPPTVGTQPVGAWTSLGAGRRAAVPGVVKPSFASQTSASLRNWWSSLPAEHILLIGIGGGVAASLLALAAGTWVSRWFSQPTAEPLPVKPYAKEIGW